MKSRLTTLINALDSANQAALEASAKKDDNGTCNLDSVIIKMRLSHADLDFLGQHCKTASIGYPLSSGLYKGHRFVGFSNIMGQADKRTAGVEAAYKVLRDSGFDVSVYYQMD
jgi:hypothetical protein